MNRALRAPALLTSLTAIAAVVTLANRSSWISTLVVLLFLAIVPGSCVVDFTGFEGSGAMRVIVVVAAGFASATILTEMMLYARVWTPERGLLAIIAACSAVIAYDAIVRRRTAHPANDGRSVNRSSS